VPGERLQEAFRDSMASPHVAGLAALASLERAELARQAAAALRQRLSPVFREFVSRGGPQAAALSTRRSWRSNVPNFPKVVGSGRFQTYVLEVLTRVS